MEIRPAVEADLERLWDIRYANDIAGADTIPARGPVPPYLPHVFERGALIVALDGGDITGYAGLVTRGSVSFLTDLFIDPEVHSRGIGQALLETVLPVDTIRTTLASTDPRAIALYSRFGMAPRWPNLLLEAEVERLRPLPAIEIEVDLIDASDRTMIEFDAEVSARSRAVDLAYFQRDEEGVAMRFRAGGETAGYGFVRFGAGRLWHPEAVTIGPICARTPELARASVIAATAWAMARGTYLEIAVPGPHPALPDLLAAGFRIVYVETYCSAEPNLIDPACYVGSGGDLF